MAPSPTIRRLLKETAELSAASPNPNPAFYAQPVSDSDLHEWHFTLVGPPEPSPYAGGLYHGRVTLPPSYPLKPPNFRFLTASGRFEVNREICLSISGFHEETWMPAWGIRTAMTALRSFMAESGTAGQVGGLEARDDVRKKLATESRSWKCDVCKASNENIMHDWWNMCQEKGVNVQEDMGLDALPEGMNLEARDPNTTKKLESPTSPRLNSASSSPFESATARSSPATDSGQVRAVAETLGLSSESSKAATAPTTPNLSKPYSNGHRRVKSSLSTVKLASPGSSSHSRSGSAQSHSAQLATKAGSHSRSPSQLTNSLGQQVHLPQTSQTQNSTDQTLMPTVTIDRAIGVVFLALCLMILKKIFYPASSVGMDEYYLLKEH